MPRTFANQVPAKSVSTGLYAHGLKPLVVVLRKPVMAGGRNQIQTSAVWSAVRRALKAAKKETAEQWLRQTTRLLFSFERLTFGEAEPSPALADE